MTGLNKFYTPIEDGDVHLWLAPLDITAQDNDRYTSLLNADDQERAARFLNPDDRDGFVAARGFLLTILGAYTKTAPDTLRLHYNPYGKPALYLCENQRNIQFNLSHSGDWALLAVTRGRR